MNVSLKHITVIVIVLSFLMISCKHEEEKPKTRQQPATLVRVQKVSLSKMVSSIDITGTIEANIVTEVKSPADGIIENLMARENQYVEKGKLIAVINPTDRVSLMSSGIEKVESLERKLKATDHLSNDYQQLFIELEKAKTDLEYAQNMFTTIPVICPMNGLVTKRWLDQGSQVWAKDNMLTITDMGSLVIKAEVNERYFEAIRQDKRLSVILNAYPNDTLTGRISLIYPQIDPVSRSVKFDIRIQNFNRTLLPGMMASIIIPVSVVEEAISIPEYAVLTSPDNKNFVFTVDNDSIAHRQAVQTGMVSGDQIQIVDGLKSGEKIVIAGQDLLKDKRKVRIMGTPKGVK